MKTNKEVEDRVSGRDTVPGTLLWSKHGDSRWEADTIRSPRLLRILYFMFSTVSIIWNRRCRVPLVFSLKIEPVSDFGVKWYSLLPQSVNSHKGFGGNKPTLVCIFRRNEN